MSEPHIWTKSNLNVYNGHECNQCGGHSRYISTDSCVTCKTREKANAGANMSATVRRRAIEEHQERVREKLAISL